MAETKVRLVGGTGRSGTTILKKVLSSHPQIAYVSEWRAPIAPTGIIHFYNTLSNEWSPFVFDFQLKQLRRTLRQVGKRSTLSTLLMLLKKLKIPALPIPYRITERYNHIKLVKYSPNFMQYIDELMDELTEFKYKGQWTGMERGEKNEIYFSRPFTKQRLEQVLGSFLRKVFNDIASHQSASFYLDDNTWNHIYFEDMLKLIPDAKLIHIYRNPRDVVSSFIGESWTPNKVEQSAIFYKSLHDYWKSVKSRLPEGSYIEVSLEELIEDPKRTLNSLCDFCGFEWSDNLLNVKLHKSSQGRWKQDLSKEEQERANEILGDIIEELGYGKDI